MYQFYYFSFYYGYLDVVILNVLITIVVDHIGNVIIGDYVEIASGCTIDRGSVNDTKIGRNTYLDNVLNCNTQINTYCVTKITIKQLIIVLQK